MAQGFDNRKLVLEWDKIQDIIALAKLDNPRDYTILMTLALSGRRIGEVVGRKGRIGRRGVVPMVPGLHLKDINFEDKQITWTIEKKFKDKTHTDRVRRIKEGNPELLTILQKWIDSQGMHYDDPDYNPRLFDISERRINQRVHLYCKHLGIDNKARLVHAFRHGFGLEYAKRMVKPSDIVILQNILDHTNTETTFGYINMSKNENAEALARMTVEDKKEKKE